MMKPLTRNIIIGLVSLALIGGGIAYFVTRGNDADTPPPGDNAPSPQPSDSAGAFPTETTPPAPEPQITPPRTGSSQGEDKSGITVTFSGEVLAGDEAKLFDFNKADYDKAVAAKKLVVLYFYANWCPICRAEIPKLYEAFGELTSADVVGFRVNFNDSDTDDTEKKLAQEHLVVYQHTKVFLKNGKLILRSPESWDKQRYLSEITKALQD